MSLGKSKENFKNLNVKKNFLPSINKSSGNRDINIEEN